MKKIDTAKRAYESLEIPENLDAVVREAIKSAGERGILHAKKVIFARAVACILVFCVTGSFIALNVSEAFATAAADIPVLGTIARVLTIREYSSKNENKDISVLVPAIDADKNSGADVNYVKQMNALITNKIEEYVKNAEMDIEAYKEAFLATGGTENEFNEKKFKVDVAYEVKSQLGSTLSFVINANENWCNAYNIQYYFNLDLADGHSLTLKDLLGKDYKDSVNKQILQQMDERKAKDTDVVYWDSDRGGFTSVDDATQFYINEAGNPVVVFSKYEIAPGSMGIQEFEIIR